MKTRRIVSALLLTALLAAAPVQNLPVAYASTTQAAAMKLGSRGENVKNLQVLLKKHGFLKEKATGYFGPATKAAVSAFQKSKGLTVDGIAGPSTLEQLTGKKAAAKQVSRGGAISRTTGELYIVQSGDSLWKLAQKFGTDVDSLMKANNLTTENLDLGQKLIIPVGTPAASPDQAASNNASSDPAQNQTSSDSKYGEYADWWTDARYAFPIKKTATVQDFDTGLTFKIRRSYGVNHADCEPLTAEDTAVMKKLYPKWSWVPRAIIIEVDGRRLAASMTAMPHSIETIGESNDFNGHFDIHFLNSRSHNTNSVREDHQAMVRKAAGK